MDFEKEIISKLNTDCPLFFYHSERISCQILSTNSMNRYCNFDGIITNKNKYLGIVEIKKYHIDYKDLYHFPLQLCKLHLPKQGVPFLLIIKCRCGTVLMYRWKKSHKCAIGQCAGYRHDSGVDSDELFFFIEKNKFKILKDVHWNLQKFYIPNKCHKNIIDESIMLKIDRIRQVLDTDFF
jgi:hypothetical protein